jgi:hypothetical protein
MRTVYITAVLILLSACRTTNESTGMDAATEAALRFMNGDCPSAKERPVEITIDVLIADPARHEGAIISLSGYYYFGYEHSAIYSSRKAEPFVQDVGAGIWVYGIPRDLSGKYVEITGVFTRANRGHLGAWPAAICVTSVAETTLDAA